ncbi:MAG: hypothetical protein AAFY82_05740 [Pseudomonadota bacterium]
MSRPVRVGPHLLALIGAVGLFASTAMADVTVYSGGKSRLVETGTERATKVIAWGQPRETTIQRRVERFQLERQIQTIIEARDTEEERAASDAMLRLMARGNANSRRQYSKFYPYHYRSAGFYQSLRRAMQEQRAGVRVYRQSILDDVPNEDLQLVAKALNEMN